MDEKVPCSNPGCHDLVKPSRFMKHHLFACHHAVMHCIYEHRGCKIRMKWGKLKEHVKPCAFAPRIVAGTALTSTSRAAPSASNLIPCVFQRQGCPANILPWMMDGHRDRCPFRRKKEVAATSEKTAVNKGPSLPPRLVQESFMLVPCPFKEFGCRVVVKPLNLNHHTSRCSLMHEQYCKLLGLSDCLLSLKRADWADHASEFHGVPAVWTKESHEFELTMDYQKTGQARDLEWLMSVDWKPVAIAVQAKKPYALWLKTEIIQGERIAWMVTHSGENCGVHAAKMTFYNVSDKKLSWTWKGPVMGYNGKFNEKCFSVPCHWLFDKVGWKLRIQICEGSMGMKKIVNVSNVWKGPYETALQSGLDSGTGIGIIAEDQTESSRKVAEIGKQSIEEEEISPEATFAAQLPREPYFAMNSLLDSISTVEATAGKSEDENEKQPKVA